MTLNASDTERAALAKIIATIGPASESPEVVRRLIEAGVAVFRFNFSHGDFAAHARRLEVVRRVSAELDRPVAVMGDLQGPKIRVGGVEGVITLEPGQEVVFRRGAEVARIEPGASGPVVVLPTTYERLMDEVGEGHRVLINDGAIRMLAVSRSRDELRCVVRVGGAVTSGKGINLPQSTISAPAITERDWECVEFAVGQDMDFLALSFVRRAEEIRDLKDGLARLCAEHRPPDADRYEGSWIPVIAKIEQPQALDDLDRIIEAADAVMVARGDLGVEMDIARVPVVQKRIVAACAVRGRPCIIATQMLETMIQNATPTRAEASDVANAIFDGADAVMLSAETATGRHPALVVETMRRIIAVAEGRLAEMPPASGAPSEVAESHSPIAALAHGAWRIASDVGAACVACWSEGGGTARYLSQNDLRVPIVAYSSSPRAARRMTLLRGVTPVRADPPPSGLLTDWHSMVNRDLLARGLADPGDRAVLLAGTPPGHAQEHEHHHPPHRRRAGLNAGLTAPRPTGAPGAPRGPCAA